MSHDVTYERMISTYGRITCNDVYNLIVSYIYTLCTFNPTPTPPKIF